MAKIPSLRPKRTENFEALNKEITPLFEQIMTTFGTLSLEENFRVHKWVGTIEPLSQMRILHSLKRVPTGRLVVKHKGGVLEDGVDDWTTTEVFLQNTHASDDLQATVLFY